MQQSKQDPHFYEEHEIDLKALFNSLLTKRFLIAGLTCFVTIPAILYTLNLTPTYKAISSFTSPSSISVTTINKLNLTNETRKSIFSEFLTKLSSKDLQKLAFLKGDFITTFNTDNSPIDDVDEFISGATKSVIVHSPDLSSKDMALGFLTELPYSVSMQGASAEAISIYLNQLVQMANSKTINELFSLNELKIENRLEEISVKINLLLEQAERVRLNQIDRIKEEDGQKIRQINDQIDRERYKAKVDRLNMIVILTDSVKLAKSLGVIENNFKLINDDGANYDLTIAIGESKVLPEWYLYGEKALIKRVELLVNRKSDDPFIPELITLKNQLNEVQKNNTLKTLEARQDNSPFIAEIINLEIEKIQLKSKKNQLKSQKIGMGGINAMQLSLISTPQKTPIKSNQILIVLSAFFGSFMMSIFLVLIMGALKPDEKAPS